VYRAQISSDEIKGVGKKSKDKKIMSIDLMIKRNRALNWLKDL